ncbi:SDR family oxidoreductase [Amycolatopsis acidiphila]|uniref:SDR family oxidoreductase n=1 Tax=Amycolatopsis acidiphila TaxID=715473 RepID=A0A558A528_9PSEU|nr:SDR family oxidoreductase [Amycolatopsis acidiphila]TVT19365.1 SDR family oxidoreductase [Amycolatopsis acidiphila]UIJ61730.1 SDR family oxidoreductase [Amycolatopsis acidiphila]GHG58177.1 3-beta hydroxysteroid dehydrogenase [Amycolatopsis acidiphila]
MRIFVTGASGWIGSAVVPELIGAGHEVVGLARSDASAQVVAGMGAEVLRGDLNDTGVLRAGALGSDGVIHLAFVVPSVTEAATQTDAKAIETFAAGLAGSGKPMLISGGTIVTPGRPSTERDELIAQGPIAARIRNMRAALAAAERDVRAALVMLPRSVHGEGERHGFIPQLIATARAKGVCGYIGDGTSRWPAVHVEDAARLYRLAVEQAPAGAVLNAVGDEGVPTREIAEAIGRHLNLPARSLPAEEFGGMLVPLLSTDMPASSAITQEVLGWKPTHPGLIEDIERGHYFS